MLILQFFGGLVVSLLASIGVLQTPGPEGLVFRRHLTVSPVTRHRRLADACQGMGLPGWDGLIGLLLMLC